MKSGDLLKLKVGSDHSIIVDEKRYCVVKSVNPTTHNINLHGGGARKFLVGQIGMYVEDYSKDICIILVEDYAGWVYKREVEKI